MHTAQCNNDTHAVRNCTAQGMVLQGDAQQDAGLFAVYVYIKRPAASTPKHLEYVIHVEHAKGLPAAEA